MWWHARRQGGGGRTPGTLPLTPTQRAPAPAVRAREAPALLHCAIPAPIAAEGAPPAARPRSGLTLQHEVAPRPGAHREPVGVHEVCPAAHATQGLGDPVLWWAREGIPHGDPPRHVRTPRARPHVDGAAQDVAGVAHDGHGCSSLLSSLLLACRDRVSSDHGCPLHSQVLSPPPWRGAPLGGPVRQDGLCLT